MADTITLRPVLKFEHVDGPEVTPEVLLDALAYDTTVHGHLQVECWADGVEPDDDTKSTYRLVLVD